jgi:hypothetical protein
MPELGTSGSVRGDASNGIPYRDKVAGIAVDTVIGVKRQSGLRDNFWLFQSLA